MSLATTSALSEAEYGMLEHIIDTRDLEELKMSKCSIYRVPCNLREVEDKAYTPKLISIGPIHFGKKELKTMQEQKKRYFHFFWERLPDENVMRAYKLLLESKEQEIRQRYAQKFTLIEKNIFVEMLRLDSVFIMELFLRNSSWKTEAHNHVATETILTQPWLIKSITRDLILLENQIPFELLDTLYETVVPNDFKMQYHCFVDLACEYFAQYDTHRNQSKKHYFSCSLHCFDSSLHCFNCSVHCFNSNKPLATSMDKDSCIKPKHFTDLIRFFYLPTDDQFGKSDCPKRVLRTASKLQEAGVSFEKVTKRRLLHITFEKTPILSSFLCFSCLPCMKHFKARVYIPQLRVDHNTECLFRNLIAFEQCHYPEQPYICNYVSLIDSLIHTKDDVELLVEKEVIVHELGSHKDVATLVNGLCQHVVADSTCYYMIINDLNEHYKNIWNRTMAALQLVYFRDPWRSSSTVVGVAVLIFAVFQFIRVVRYLF